MKTLLCALLVLLTSCNVGCSGARAGSSSSVGSSPAAGAASSGNRCAWALGYAAGTLGGRRGAIVKVTTLNPTGPGSLSEAVATSGPRIVVFEVGGVIDLFRTNLDLREPFLTIAGQTAPSPGITLIQGGVHIATHDVLIQHLRVRPGEAGQAKGSGWEPDGISSTTGAYNVVVDHCSTTWAVDENLSASGGRFVGNTPDEWRQSTTHQVTFSNNIIAEGLSNSTHHKGEHSKGSLIHDNVSGALIYGNLYASNTERNPFFKGGARGAVVNNFIANPGKYALKFTLVADEWGTHEYQTGQMAVVGNVLHYGPSTRAGMPLLFSSGAGKCEVYLSDNIAKDASGADIAELAGTTANFIEQTQPPTWPEGLRAMPSSAVIDYVAKNAGARPWERDAIDARIVAAALAGTGQIIDSEQEAGGYPALSPTEASFNEDEWDLDCLVKKP